MNKLVFQVEFLSDIVLPATSNTEGNIEQLDFIPGSNFLGMVAREYDKYEDGFAVFHSGAVRFGDATILKDGKQTYKMPLSYFHEKLDDSKIFNHHHIEDFNAFSQLKQMRNGYITKDKESVEINHNYAQKSGYDKEKRRSKDSAMYGYSAIRSGTKWQFTLTHQGISENDLERIKSNLIGKKRLGKSKSAQYGQVKIALSGENENIESSVTGKRVILYAKSRLALVDESGSPTYELEYLSDGLEGKVVYEASQIRTSSFTPYVAVRQTKDYERIVINKGSVIVLQDVTAEQIDAIREGVGVYRSEGFGEVLINPEFLNEKAVVLADAGQKKAKPKEKAEIAQSMSGTAAQFLANRHNDTIEKLKLANAVETFMNMYGSLYGNIKPSQWGTIRSICTRGSEDFEGDIKTYISSGKVTWSEKQVSVLLNAIKNNIEFAKLLSMQIPKRKGDK